MTIVDCMDLTNSKKVLSVEEKNFYKLLFDGEKLYLISDDDKSDSVHCYKIVNETLQAQYVSKLPSKAFSITLGANKSHNKSKYFAVKDFTNDNSYY